MARAPAPQETEDLPEADRLEGFPHPRETVKVFGHESAEREFADAFSSGRIHHAWLITGPRGIARVIFTVRCRSCGSIIDKADETQDLRSTGSTASPPFLVSAFGRFFVSGRAATAALHTATPRDPGARACRGRRAAPSPRR